MADLQFLSISTEEGVSFLSINRPPVNALGNQLLDEIGLDVARKVAHVLRDAFGERMPAATLIDRLVAAGELGRKSEMGFYNYEDGKRKGVNSEIESSNPAEGALTPYDPALEEEIAAGRAFMHDFRDTFHQLAK